jgi:3-dehydroquinate dehydratase-2
LIIKAKSILLLLALFICMKITIINGPNLNLLGKREPGIYGNLSFEEYFKKLQSKYEDIEFTYFQSNHEGEIIDCIQKKGFTDNAIIINGGAFTHTSVAIADAIRAIDAAVIEVHISNTFARESFRHHSYLSPVCIGVIAGFGLDSYELAVRYLMMRD